MLSPWQVGTLGLLFVVVVGSGGISRAWAGRILSDAELGQVRAGAFAVRQLGDSLAFEFDGGSVNGSGTLTPTGTIQGGSLGSVVIRDAAQSELRSVVNINAANAMVQVLINLNVNINSTVGTLRQVNLGLPF